MKKILVFITATALTALLLSSCTAFFPSMDKVVVLTDEKATELLNRKTEKEIHDKWGQPDAFLSGFYGDIYTQNDRQIVIYYDADGKVTDVRISER